ncbi:FUSC family protein [Vibrio breoganii]|uniref:FUSC family protein n=1 Tax=Vibrio breoganii TaxID=553239 RepID=UPI000C81E5AB|nr:FUSC family protein [Vibrio breoganii]PML33305.1 hypothetical protein BCT78_15085 [Vibrio breoganii]
MLDNFAKNIIPPKPYLVLGNRMFLLSAVLLVISAYLYNVDEAFVAVEVGIIHFLYNLKFANKKTVLWGGLEPLVTTLIAVPLSLVPMPYAPFTTAIFVFVLVLIERDNHHQGVPKYILPLSFLLLSMMMVPQGVESTELMIQRSVSVVLGIVVAMLATAFVWPNASQNQTQDKAQDKAKRTINKVDVKYSSRKALGIGLILSLGFIDGSGAALAAYLFMMIHSPISKQLAPKAWQRFSGTVLGAAIYVPLGLLMGYLDSELMVTAIKWSLVIVSLYMILVYLEHNYTVATAFIMLLILAYAVGPFNLQITELVFMPRFWNTLIGGGVMVLLGFLVPLRDKDFA